jgi:hypothetical protein
MKALTFKQRSMIEIDFLPDEAWQGSRNNGFDAHFRCISCDSRVGWDPKIGLYQCLLCGYDATRQEIIDLCLEYRSQIDLLLMNNEYLKPKRTFWQRLFRRK